MSATPFIFSRSVLRWPVAQSISKIRRTPGAEFLLNGPSILYHDNSVQHVPV
ncbi:TPA: hypothetical protein L7312_001691 [Escherichia coli]|nr:hypothetical protein [Escherichia coli]EMA2734220.1 hypothetical protein [Escherichia coli]HBI2749159.1 hypothetical protein [Escherichia coli]HBI2854125.1 hypothetical protein [Escherichia coli]HBQ4749612.1 hypothetical protein [Escherichia coli]